MQHGLPQLCMPFPQVPTVKDTATGALLQQTRYGSPSKAKTQGLREVQQAIRELIHHSAEFGMLYSRKAIVAPRCKRFDQSVDFVSDLRMLKPHALKKSLAKRCPNAFRILLLSIAIAS